MCQGYTLFNHLEQTPYLLLGVTGWLRPVGEKVSVAEARKGAPAAHAWSNQPLRSLLTVACMLALGQQPRHDPA